MKNIVAIVAGVSLACGLAVTAGAQRGAPMRGPGGGPRGADAVLGRQLFRGITLTDAEQAQLQKLRDDNRTRTRALAKSAQADRQSLRTARENGDTIALKAARENREGYRNKAIAFRGEYGRSVRAVLTPDQQKIFDANRARAEQRGGRAARMARRGRMRDGRGAMRRGFGHPRGGMRLGGPPPSDSTHVVPPVGG